MDVFVGDAFTHANFIGPEGQTLNGWNGTFGGNLTRWLGAEADVSGHYGTFANAFRTSVTYFTAGPRLTLHFGESGTFQPPRFSPFLHVLAGGVRGSIADFSETAFATMVGGGLDLNIGENMAIRLPKVDYIRTRFGDEWQNNWRIGIGGVFRFGSETR